VKSERELREDIVEVGHRVWEKGYVAANDGNISARLSRNEVLTTPTGVSKGFLTPEALVKVDMEGNVLEGRLTPSSEIKMHLSVYRAREDVCGVLHAHPPTATGFAVAGMALDRPTLPEVVISLKAIPLAEYGTPSTEELAQTLEPYLQEYDAFLLANHGALTVGRDVFQAYYRLETIEHCAQISLAARILGKEQTLTPPQVERLLELRENMGIENRGPCLGCGICEARESHQQFVETCGYSAAYARGTQDGRQQAQGSGEERSGGKFASGRVGSEQEAPKLTEEELREIVARVAREVLAGTNKALDAVWRE
jgi:L-fuculose-phosphate aldolase